MRARRPSIDVGTRAFAAVLLTLSMLLGTPAVARQPACEGYLATIGDDHPLACRIFAADGSDVTWAGLADRLSRADLVLLGEVHDNPDHHRLRASLIAALGNLRNTAVPAPRPLAIVMEHIRADQQPALDAYADMIRAAQPGDDIEASVDQTLAALDWDKSGWSEPKMFRPLFIAVGAGRHPILAGEPARAAVRSVARQGIAALAGDEAARLKLGDALPSPLHDALLGELEASHCGLMPKSAFGTMADAQRFRDAHQAAVLLGAADRHGRAVLLAGNGHVRADRGVPWHLARLAPARSVAIVMFVEVDAARTNVADYLERGADGKPIADLVVVTPRSDRPDPCIEMRKRFGR